MKRGGGDPRDTKHKIDARRLCDGPLAGETGRTRAGVYAGPLTSGFRRHYGLKGD